MHLAIYRILQEQMTNVSKYAEAALVSVRFTTDAGNLVLTVSEDGKGFQAGQKRSGIGITNMLMQAESVGGILTIDSEPGKGCKLIARFPLPLS